MNTTISKSLNYQSNEMNGNNKTCPVLKFCDTPNIINVWVSQLPFAMFPYPRLYLLLMIPYTLQTTEPNCTIKYIPFIKLAANYFTSQLSEAGN